MPQVDAVRTLLFAILDDERGIYAVNAVDYPYVPI